MNNSIYREEKYGAPTWASNENIMYMLNTVNDPICKKCPSHSDTITNETDNNNNTEDGANGGAFNLDLELTQDCNYACKYCIERGYFEPKFMHPHIVEEVIKKAAFLLSKKSNNYCNAISFGYWGGEPTLNNDAITRITRYFMKDDRVSFNVFTNSRLLSNYYDLIEETKQKRTITFILSLLLHSKTYRRCMTRTWIYATYLMNVEDIVVITLSTILLLSTTAPFHTIS